jgi:hypothetical protein
VNNFLKLGNTYGIKKSFVCPPTQEKKVIKQLSAGRTLGKLAQDPNIQMNTSTLSRKVAKEQNLVAQEKETTASAYYSA